MSSPAPPERAVVVANIVLMLVAVGLVIAGQIQLRGWFIEDAAISFAYARNLAEGHGLVPWPGGERVEGYSNPTWTALLAVLFWFGADPFPASKVAGAILAVATLPLVWLLARRTRPALDLVPGAVALTLALDSRFQIWGSSGLENALVTFLTAAAAVRITHEHDHPEARPWSALLATLVAISRPEGPMVAAWLGLFAMVAGARRPGRARWMIGWVLLAAVPFFGYHAARYAYFAWPLPNTYYAKVVEETFDPYVWSTRGWLYLRRFWSIVGNSKEPGLAVGFLLPLVWIALTGVRGWRGAVALVCLVVVTPIFLFPLPDDLAALAPEGAKALDPGQWMVDEGWIERKASWADLRVWSLIALSAISGLLLVDRPRSAPVAVAWSWALSACIFTVYTGGDWMQGYRWMAFVSVPLALLLVGGVAELTDRVREIVGSWRPAPRLGAVLSGLVIVAVPIGSAVPNHTHFSWFLRHDETSPFDVQVRVNYLTWVQRRLHLERVTAMDVDMGAHMWWSGWQMVDMAALVDVPMARHLYEKPFMKEYVFGERRPEFAHVHGSWATRTRIPQHPEWREQYLEIPGFPSGKTQIHPGSHVRRDLIVRSAWEDGPDRRVDLSDGVRIEGWTTPYTTAAGGEHLYIEVAFSTTTRVARTGDLRLIVFLTDGAEVVASWAAPPGYDWYPLPKWKIGEVVVGTYSLPIPADLEHGTYELGFVVVGPTGAPLVPQAPLPATVRADAAPVFATAEVRGVAEIRITTAQEVQAEADALLAEIDVAAKALDCEGAAKLWDRARNRLPRRFAWQTARRPAAWAVIARCYATRAEGRPTDDALVDLAVAHDFNPDDRVLDRVRAPLVDTATAWGRSAEAAGTALGHVRRGRCAEATASAVEVAAGPWRDAHQAELDAAVSACAPLEGAVPEMSELERSAWAEAFTRYQQALETNATLSWTRRDLERVRDRRLGLDPESLAEEAAAKEAKKAASKKRAEEARKAREAARADGPVGDPDDDREDLEQPGPPGDGPIPVDELPIPPADGAPRAPSIRPGPSIPPVERP